MKTLTTPKNVLRKALDYAVRMHQGQRYGDQEFITHPILTAQLLEMIGASREVIAAGYLHDILEDTEATYEDLERMFGIDVARLVREVTKTGYNAFPNLVTLEGILVLFASRFANLAHIKDWPTEDKIRYIQKSKFWKP